jgi:hypothetical protein
VVAQAVGVEQACGGVDRGVEAGMSIRVASLGPSRSASPTASRAESPRERTRVAHRVHTRGGNEPLPPRHPSWGRGVRRLTSWVRLSARTGGPCRACPVRGSEHDFRVSWVRRASHSLCELGTHPTRPTPGGPPGRRLPWRRRPCPRTSRAPGHVGGRRRLVPAWVGRGSAVAGPVAGHPAHAALSGGWEQGLGRRAEVGRAVVPEHRAYLVTLTRRGVPPGCSTRNAASAGARATGDADVRRWARPLRRSCSTGMRCCTGRMSGLPDAPPPSGRDS